MKAEQRHQLHTNALADRMGRLLEGVKSSPRSTSVLVWLFVILVVGTFGLWQYYAYATQVESSADWVQVDKANHDPETGFGELFTLAKDNPGSIPGRTAGFQVARAQLQRGQQQLSSSLYRAEAIKQLTGARDRYADLANRCADAPELAQEALMGVAKAEESLSGATDPESTEADLGRAKLAYRKLADKFPDSDLGRAARERADYLESHSSELVKFYQELNQLAAPKTKLETPGP